MTHANVSLQDQMWYLESFAVLGVHGDSIDQLVAVGESLFIELALLMSHLSRPFNLRWTSRTIMSI